MEGLTREQRVLALEVGRLRLTFVTSTCVRIRRAGTQPPPSPSPRSPRCPKPSRVVRGSVAENGRLVHTTQGTDHVRLECGVSKLARGAFDLAALTVDFCEGTTTERVWPLPSKPTRTHGLQYQCERRVLGVATLDGNRLASAERALANDYGFAVIDDTPADRRQDEFDVYLLVYGAKSQLLYRDLAVLYKPQGELPRWLFGILWSVPSLRAADAYAERLLDHCGQPLSAALVAAPVPGREQKSCRITQRLAMKVHERMVRRPSDRSGQRQLQYHTCLTLVPKSSMQKDSAKVCLHSRDVGHRSLRDELLGSSLALGEASLSESDEEDYDDEDDDEDDEEMQKPLELDLAESRKRVEQYKAHVLQRLVDAGVRGFQLGFNQAVSTSLADLLVTEPLVRGGGVHSSLTLSCRLTDSIAGASLAESLSSSLSSSASRKRLDAHKVVMIGPYAGTGTQRLLDVVLAGEVEASWGMLCSLPALLAGAARSHCPLWSVPVLGTRGGCYDPELYVRWLQLAVLCPLLRFDTASTAGTPASLTERRPWCIGRDDRVRESLALRRALVPHMHALAVRCASGGGALVQDMALAYPGVPDAYHCPEQFLLGGTLLVAPFVHPANRDIGLARATVWFPPGAEWHEVFGEGTHAGGSWEAVYGNEEDIPLYARDGALVLMAGRDTSEQLDVRYFAGSGPCAEERLDVRDASGALAASVTARTRALAGGKLLIEVVIAQESTKQRSYRLKVHGVSDPCNLELAIEGSECSVKCSLHSTFDKQTLTCIVEEFSLNGRRRATVTMTASADPRARRKCAVMRQRYTLRQLLKHFKAASCNRQRCWDLLLKVRSPIGDAEKEAATQLLGILEGPEVKRLVSQTQMRALVEVACAVGFTTTTTRLGARRERHVVAWNTHGIPGIDLVVPAGLGRALCRFYGLPEPPARAEDGATGGQRALVVPVPAKRALAVQLDPYSEVCVVCARFGNTGAVIKTCLLPSTTTTPPTSTEQLPIFYSNDEQQQS